MIRTISLQVRFGAVAALDGVNIALPVSGWSVSLGPDAARKVERCSTCLAASYPLHEGAIHRLTGTQAMSRRALKALAVRLHQRLLVIPTATCGYEECQVAAARIHPWRLAAALDAARGGL